MKVLFTVVTLLFLLLFPVNGAYSLGLDSQNLAIKAPEFTNDCGPLPDDIITADYSNHPFQNPDVIQSKNGLLETSLEVKKAENKIADCVVNLRSYNGKLVGPTLRAKPGDTIRIKLINELDPIDPKNQLSMNDSRLVSETDCTYELETHVNNTPHDFNVTNFHAHGLHVDPNGCSDNVLRVMRPRLKSDDSPPEYLIEVKIPVDHPAGTFWYHAHLHGSTALQVSSGMAGALIIEGGLDNVPSIAEAPEKIFVFQQIAYDKNGEIENYDDFGPNQWKNLGRHTTINGQIIPVIRMRPGEVQRWRLIHAGVRESINLELRNAVNEQIPLNEIAVDGIVLGQLDTWKNKPIELEPGYRSDVLVKAPPLADQQLPQEYVLNDSASSPQRSLLGDGEAGSILAKVIIEGEPISMGLPSSDELAEVKLKDAPKDIAPGEISGPAQFVSFSINNGKPVTFTVNGESFDLDKPRVLQFNQAQVWTLETDKASLAPSHPFHIHVNPFQYERIGPSNQKELIWKDTLMVAKGQPLTIKSRYTDFLGRFVLHCHILDHEDQGMMQVVQISD
jgi:FtsP/CotA-like multicopper oxidase with cupredoxin domain